MELVYARRFNSSLGSSVVYACDFVCGGSTLSDEFRGNAVQKESDPTLHEFAILQRFGDSRKGTAKTDFCPPFGLAMALASLPPCE